MDTGKLAFMVILFAAAGATRAQDFMGSTNVAAEEDSSSAGGFDSIVSSLRLEAEDPVQPSHGDDWDEVALHGGMGLTASYVHLDIPGARSTAGVLKGFEFNFGINLFSRRARAEGVLRNFNREDLSTDLNADLKEFEFRGVFLPPIRDKMKLRVGAGIVSRYMNVSTRNAGGWTNHRSSTPAASLLLGLERKITSTVSVGPDLDYRSALVADTIDRSSWNASLRLNATF